MQAEISAQGNMVQLGAGQGCGVVASTGHGGGFAVNQGDCCVPAEAGTGLERSSNKDQHDYLPSKHAFCHAVLHCRALLPLLLLQEHCLRSSSSLGGWTTARSFACECNQRWKKHHWEKNIQLYFPGNVCFWKCNAFSNSTAPLLGLGLKILLKKSC